VEVGGEKRVNGAFYTELRCQGAKEPRIQDLILRQFCADKRMQEMKMI